MFRKLLQGEKATVTEVDATMKNKWNWKWLEEKVQTNVTLTREKDCVSCNMEGCMGGLIHKVNQLSQALCAWCHEIIKYGSKGK